MMRSNLKMTATEIRAVLAAFAVVEAHAPGWTKGDMLAQAFKAETTGSDRLPAIQAKALLSKWFADAVARPDMLAAQLYALRPACVLISILGTVEAANLTDKERTTLADGRKAYDAAFERYLNATRDPVTSNNAAATVAGKA